MGMEHVNFAPLAARVMPVLGPWRSIGKGLKSTFPPRHHWRRYALGALATVLAIIGAAAAYMKLTPPNYTSKWTFILPGAGSGSSLSLESVGQATSLAASPFSSPSLSPKVIYKEIATSDQVLASAANAADIEPAQFGRPQIKLIDETALMIFEISGRTPEEAKRKAEGLITAFEEQLNLLRRDEIERRAVSVRETLQGYQTNLRAARNRIFDSQEASGLVSLDQFTAATASADALRAKLSEVRADFVRRQSEFESMVKRLGISPDLASMALVLAADPVFMKSLIDYAEADASIAGQAAWIGPNNPVLRKDLSKRTAAFASLNEAAVRGGLDAFKALPGLLLIANSKAREDLFKTLIIAQSELEGKRSELKELQDDFITKQKRVKEMSGMAAQLEDLKKDHLVAEAVFTSAVARLDTNKADLYASYPIVQLLAKPDLPRSITQPRLGLAIAGAIGGSSLGICAWTLAWLRQLFVRKRKKKE